MTNRRAILQDAAALRLSALLPGIAMAQTANFVPESFN